MMLHIPTRHRHPLVDRRDDLYETPPEATRALLKVENLPHRIWEPACGRGAIVNVLRAAGHDVVASDLVDHGAAVTPPGWLRVDFLMERTAPEGTEGIVTNAPFKLAEEFAAHAIQLCSYVAMLMRFAFFEGGTGRQRRHLLRRRVLDEVPPARVHVFRKRLPMMHRAGWTGPRASSQTAFAWFIWDRSHTGATTLDRIDWN